MTEQLFKETDHYISRLLAPEDEALQGITQSLADAGISDMSVSATQGKLLQVMAAACRAERILELGTFGGYSTVWLARALPEHGKLISLEFDEKHAAIARKNIERAGLQSKIEVRVGKAIDLLQQMHAANEAPFDLIFIDADKPPYAEYFQWSLKLARPGSIIIADNVVRNGQVLDPNSPDDKVQGVQRFNELLSSCKEVTATILQTVGVKEYDGIAIAVVN